MSTGGNFRKRPEIISVFNHKGGVGKTTSTITLGWELAEKGLNVLLVDADPQCNMTGFLTDPGFEALGVECEIEDDPLAQFYNRYPACNIYAAFSPLLGDSETRKSLEAVRGSAEVFQVLDRNQFLPQGQEPLSKPPKGLYLLGGSPDFNLYEPQLFRACENPNAFPDAKEVPGYLRHVLKGNIRHNGTLIDCDIILVDLSPSASAINKICLTSSDAFIVPCSPDFFSSMAIDSLSGLLLDWDKWKTDLQRRTSDAMCRLPDTKPVFLGYTIQVFSLYKGNPVAAFAKWIDAINTKVEATFIPKLAVRGMAIRGMYAKLGQIPNFQSLAPASSRANIPVPALTPSQVKKTTASDLSKKQLQLKEIFSGFCDAVVERLESKEITKLRKFQEDIATLQFYNKDIENKTPEELSSVAQQLRDIQ